MDTNVYNFKVNQINGTPAQLEEYKNKVLLVVNVASECGLTPQYEALEKIYEKYHPQGFEVLAFPANEFGAQEPGSNEQIQNFCTSKFGVRFPLFEKIVVKGEGQHPLYQYLTQAQPEAQSPKGKEFEEKLKTYGIHRGDPNSILWNFEKFLVNKKGQVKARFNPDLTPDDQIITEAIESALKE